MADMTLVEYLIKTSRAQSAHAMLANAGVSVMAVTFLASGTIAAGNAKSLVFIIILAFVSFYTLAFDEADQQVRPEDSTNKITSVVGVAISCGAAFGLCGVLLRQFS